MKKKILLGNTLSLFSKLNSDDKSNATKTNLNVEKVNEQCWEPNAVKMFGL